MRKYFWLFLLLMVSTVRAGDYWKVNTTSGTASVPFTFTTTTTFKGPTPWVDVRAYGATGNGSTDDTSAIQDSINAAGGGTVFFPKGVYKLSSGLSLNSAVTLKGVGWGTPVQDSVGTPTNSTAEGTWFYIPNTATTTYAISILSDGGRGATIRDVAFVHQQPTNITAGLTPVAFPHTIFVSADDVLLENIFLRNATKGILISRPGSGIGRITLNRIWGQPLTTGIEIDNVLDVVKVNNVHFWTFWSSDSNATSYTRHNLKAIYSKRDDNPHFSNIFCSDAYTLFEFGASTITVGGSTSKFRISNADCDGCSFGVKVTGDSTTGMISNFTTQGNSGATSGIEVSTTNVALQIENYRANEFNNSGIYVGGSGSYVQIHNAWIQKWDEALFGYPGIEADTGATVVLGGNIRFSTGGTGTIQTGGSGTILRSMMDAPTAGHGETAFSMANNTGDTLTNLTFAAQAGARTYTIPDAGGNANFVLSVAGLSTTTVSYIDPTSSIQSQFNTKAPLAAANATGNWTFDSNTLSIDSSNHWVGLGTNSPAARLELAGVDASNTAKIFLTNGTGGTGARWGIASADSGKLYISQMGVGDSLIISPTTMYAAMPGVYSNTTASAANVEVDSDGTLKRSTSSRRYKTSIQDYTSGLSYLLRLHPVSYVGKNDKNKKRHAGFIAEDVDATGLKEFVVYDPKGKPDSLEYGNLSALIVNAVKELSAKNDALEKRLTVLEKK